MNTQISTFTLSDELQQVRTKKLGEFFRSGKDAFESSSEINKGLAVFRKSSRRKSMVYTHHCRCMQKSASAKSY